MKINIEQLPQQLKKTHAGFWIASDEVFLQQIAADSIRKHAYEGGFLERNVFHIDSQFNWELVYQQLDNLSLFSQTQFLELRFVHDKLNDADRKALQQCIKKLNPDILLLILTNKIEAQTQKAKWFEEITRNICFVPIWPIAQQQYFSWIKNRSIDYKLNIEQSGLQLLAAQTQNNPLAADQILQQLQLLYTLPDSASAAPSLRATGEAIEVSMQNRALNLDCAAKLAMTGQAHNDETISINREMICEITHQAMQSDLFTFVDVFLSAHTHNAMTHLQLLKNQNIEPILIIWALARELRTVNHMLLGANPYIWPSRQALMAHARKHFTRTKIHILIQQLARIDLYIKGIQPGNPWLALERFILC